MYSVRSEATQQLLRVDLLLLKGILMNAYEHTAESSEAVAIDIQTANNVDTRAEATAKQLKNRRPSFYSPCVFLAMTQNVWPKCVDRSPAFTHRSRYLDFPPDRQQSNLANAHVATRALHILFRLTGRIPATPIDIPTHRLRLGEVSRGLTGVPAITRRMQFS